MSKEGGGQTEHKGNAQAFRFAIRRMELPLTNMGKTVGKMSWEENPEHLVLSLLNLMFLLDIFYDLNFVHKEDILTC